MTISEEYANRVIDALSVHLDPMGAFPIVSPNGKWLRCGKRLVATRHIKTIELTMDKRSFCVTLSDAEGTRVFTRTVTPEEAQQVICALYGQSAEDA